jgi:hypothetical protein
MNYAPLINEINTDPHGLGFAALKTAGNFNGIAAIFASTTNAGAGTVTMPSVDSVDFVTAFLPHLLPMEALSSAARVATYDRLWSAILSMPTIDFSNSNVQNLLTLAVSDSLLTQPQATALNQRQGSYAEMLCGAGAAPSGSDISALFHTPTP